MTPVEGARFFGISNMCRVVMGGLPELPWDDEAEELVDIKNVVWSVIGSGSSGDQSTVDEVKKLMKKHTNIVGAVMDDFFSETRMELYPPSAIADIRNSIAPLPLWSVIYERELDETRMPYIAECDKVSFWTWYAENLSQLYENFEKVKRLSKGEKGLLQGVYMYDYGNRCPISDEAMHAQLDVAYRLLKEGETEGIIICSNCIADIGLTACDIMKAWMDEHGDEEL